MAVTPAGKAVRFPNQLPQVFGLSGLGPYPLTVVMTVVSPAYMGQDLRTTCGVLTRSSD